MYLAPGTYSPEKYGLDQQPSFTFGSRPEEKVKTDIPGKCMSADPSILYPNKFAIPYCYLPIAPGTYSPEKCNLDHQPSYSFGSRPADKIKSDIPGMLKHVFIYFDT